MKKFLLLVMSLALGFGAYAQRYATINLEKAPVGSFVQNHKAPAVKDELKVNQRLMGYYTSDEWSSNGGVGFGKTMTLRMGAKITPDMLANFVNGRVVGIRYAMCYAEKVTKVFVQKEGETTDAVSKDLTGTCNVGWNTVMFDTPWTIADGNTALFIGYDATLTGGKYSISVGNQNDPHADGLMAYGDLGQSGVAWYNISASGGKLLGDLSVQAIVELDNLAPQDLQVKKLVLAVPFAQSGKEVPFSFTLRQNGTETATSYKLNVLFGNKVVKTINGTTAIKGNSEIKIEDKIMVPEGTASGSHKVTVQLTEVNGQAPAANVNDDKAEADLSVFAEVKDRQKFLIEHYTSHTCTYCYLGDEFLTELNKLRDDMAWVSIHGNMSATDPFNTPKCDNIMNYGGLKGFPGASYNRTFVEELAQDQNGNILNTIIYGIGYREPAKVAKIVNDDVIKPMVEVNPAFSHITVAPVYDEKSRNITVDVQLNGVTDVASILKDYGLYVYLTEDGVIDRQYKAGSWVQKYTHNHVLREVLTSEYGDKIDWNGNAYTKQFTYTVPATYKADQGKTHTPDVKKMRVIAFVAPIAKAKGNDMKKMAVDNCEAADVKIGPSGINDVNSATDVKIVEVYTVTGQRLSTLQRGVNIVRYSNGKVEKVFVAE